MKNYKLTYIILLLMGFCTSLLAQNETPSSHFAAAISPSQWEFGIGDIGELTFKNEVGSPNGQQYEKVVLHVEKLNPGLNPKINFLHHINRVDGKHSTGVLLHISHGGNDKSIQMESFIHANNGIAMAVAQARLAFYGNLGYDIAGADKELEIHQQSADFDEDDTPGPYQWSIYMFDRAITKHAHGLAKDKPLVYIATCYGSLMAPAYTGRGARVALGNVDTCTLGDNIFKIETFFKRMNGKEGQAKRPVSAARAGLAKLAAVGAENTTLAPSVLYIEAPCPIKVGDKVTIHLDTKCDVNIKPDIVGVGCDVGGEAWLNSTTLQGTVTAPPPPGAYKFSIILKWNSTWSKNNRARLDGNTNPGGANAKGPAHDDYKEDIKCPQPPKKININVRNETGANKTDFHIVFKGDVRGGNPIAWRSNEADKLGDVWAVSNQTSVVYDANADETCVNYFNPQVPIPNGEYVHFGYFGKTGLQMVRMYWTPTTDPPAPQDRVPINDVTILPSDDNTTITIENTIRTDEIYGFTDPVGYIINYRVAPYEIALENLSFSDPEIEALPIFFLDSCLLQPDEPLYYELIMPDDIQENEYLIIEVHTDWDLNGNTASYLALYENNAEEACTPNLYIYDDPVADGTHQAGETIYSTGVVPSGGTVSFKAGDRITFDVGAKIEAGSNFNASIEACVDDVDNGILSDVCNEDEGFYFDFADGIANVHNAYLTEFGAMYLENPALPFEELAMLASNMVCDNNEQVAAVIEEIVMLDEPQIDAMLAEQLGANMNWVSQITQAIDNAVTVEEVMIPLDNLLEEIHSDVAMSCENKAMLTTMIRTGQASTQFWLTDPMGIFLLESSTCVVPNFGGNSKALATDWKKIAKADLKGAGIAAGSALGVSIICGPPGWAAIITGIGLSAAINSGWEWWCD